MKKKNAVTNEELKKKCKNNFTLAKIAIGLARAQIKRGEPCTLHDILEQLENYSF